FEAIHYIRKAISLDDDNPDYMIVAIDVYRRAGLYLEAVELYKKVIQSGYQEPEIYIDYAELLLDMDEVSESFRVFEEGLRQHPDADELHAIYAGYLLSTGDLDLGMSELRAARALNEDIGKQFYEFFPHLKNEPGIKSTLG
ncbi:MAG: hypothetical protein LPK46_07025, partial [Bacteroidota bacterium]|nr:hypothetical protein [Bacteroidota bacterium]MDX5428036.1 hypothetical protein [Bacteroidota bacterium]MDX5505873.1 hypothetical protein [Bacteroidota bacterium]